MLLNKRILKSSLLLTSIGKLTHQNDSALSTRTQRALSSHHKVWLALICHFTAVVSLVHEGISLYNAKCPIPTWASKITWLRAIFSTCKLAMSYSCLWHSLHVVPHLSQVPSCSIMKQQVSVTISLGYTRLVMQTCHYKRASY